MQVGCPHTYATGLTILHASSMSSSANKHEDPFHVISFMTVGGIL